MATDSDRSIGSRAFSYLYKYQFKSFVENENENDKENENEKENDKEKKQRKKTKKTKGKKPAKKENGLLKVVEYLQEYAQDDKEVNHVYFFVRNCAGDRTHLLTDENKCVLDVQGIVELLNKQQQDIGLNGRQTCLLVFLLYVRRL